MAHKDDIGFDFQPELPVGISCVGGRYLLFDVRVATYLRRNHNICGMTIGSLPLAPSQNLFLGMPIEIMPEEAQVLVEKKVAFIVDDAREHQRALQTADAARRADYRAHLQKQTQSVEQVRAQERAESKKRGLEKVSKKAAGTPQTSVNDQPARDPLDFENVQESQAHQSSQADDNVADSTASGVTTGYEITPTTSQLLVPTNAPSPSLSNASTQAAVPNLPSSYPLYRHLHSQGYFATPGLRFGCQYTVYPGDPLRFHSHFLAVGTEWDEEIDLMDIVGGGRLGTGVKKGFLIGAQSPVGDVRTFSVEWAAM
ncbi:tRNA-intron endonuclease [Exophiala mesophila]|uniref:tRNA-splicing endonuclease subunit Sen34 n=1 Tax=Exophiala mesophila TaxID=212818 RepID=A0A0D1ZIN8_EXOME|nr:tRNA-intron endonuclease [Exophiala mesophila]KIV93794.1 tRNA-intron endonuclease [Exophiala mesophila]